MPGTIGMHTFPVESVHLTRVAFVYVFTLESIAVFVRESSAEAREVEVALCDEKEAKLTSGTATIAAGAAGVVTVPVNEGGFEEGELSPVFRLAGKA